MYQPHCTRELLLTRSGVSHVEMQSILSTAGVLCCRHCSRLHSTTSQW